MTAKNTTVSLRIKQHIIMVDADDWAQLRNYKWHVNRHSGRFYVARTTSRKNGPQRQVYMHQMILSAPKSLMVDHINGNGLDNRKENLRLATNAENQHNARKTRGVSKFKGVAFARREGCWRAQICVQNRLIWLGYHQTEEGAALAYNTAAIKHYGAFAMLNLV